MTALFFTKTVPVQALLLDSSQLIKADGSRNCDGLELSRQQQHFGSRRNEGKVAAEGAIAHPPGFYERDP